MIVNLQYAKCSTPLCCQALWGYFKDQTIFMEDFK